MIEHRIKLTTNEPIRPKPYKLPYHLTEVVDKELDELLRLGFIEPCHGSAYASPIVVVQKQDTDQIRFLTQNQCQKLRIFWSKWRGAGILAAHCTLHWKLGLGFKLRLRVALF